MTASILEIELNGNAQSWVAVGELCGWYLFYVEWDYNRRVDVLEVL